MTSSDIAAIILGTRSPMHFLNFETNTKKCPKALLDDKPADDYDFIHGDRNVTNNKIYGGCASKIVSTLQESQEPTFDDTIEQVRTDNLSAVIAARNMDALPPVKSESKTSDIKQQQSRDRFKSPDDQYSQEYDISSQSRELQDYTHKDSVSNTTARLQQQSQITRCILQTPAIISKTLSSSFEILEQSNTTKRCTKDTTKTSAILSAEIEIPRNIPLKWSSMKQPCPCRKYHTWKISPGIENDINRDDVFASDTRALQREQSTRYGSSQFHGLTCFGSTENQGSRNLSSCPSSVSRRNFSSKSCTVIQSSVRKIETSRKDMFSANLSIIRLKNRVSLMKLQSFSCDASKKSSEENDGSKSQQKSRYKVEDSCSRKDRDKSEKRCEKTRSRRKEACGRVSSRNGTCEKRQESECESCVHHTCPEVRIQRRCNWEREQCPEKARRKRDAKERAAKRDPSCSQKQDIDTKCSQRQRSKSCTRRKDCEKPPLVVCKNSAKRKNDCRESKFDKKKQSKCTGNDQKRSESCQKRISSRSRGDKNCGKIDGKRHYSEQTIFSISRDHRSFSTFIPDIVLDTDMRKTTKAFYSSCGKNEKKDIKQGPSCQKQKRKCETTKKDETKKKCVKGPAKCMSRKSIVDETQACQSKKAKDEDKKFKVCEPTQKSCSHVEYCANRKIESITKDKKPKEKAAKKQPPITVKDKKPMDESIKKQIEREYKEIDECKKGKVIEKKEKKKDCTKYKSTDLDSVINLYKQEEIKNNEKFRSVLNKPIFSNSIAYKMLSILSNIINGKISIIPKDIKLLNVMFDRSFSTTKVSYQDDFAIKRTTDHSKTVQNYSANNSDFIHGDESPNYIEIENDDEEEDDYDWIVGRPTSEIN